ncbi:hypothetical protein L596_005056 [Steinernema carpocapsae]|uniref:J domain-containing protein n=1 Tax=Steinernema carpocapsae TaxID=34508 RepID=A0A4U8V1C2_STECR|nr:hypothetical protein L596_005056 [Steinernema carpocapsae]
MKYFAIALGLLALIEAAQCVGMAEGLYCGKQSCYDVLDIDRAEFNKSTLAKSYRKLAKQYHPDRIKDKEERAAAEEQFRLIATAYETLKDDETRKLYEYYLDHPEYRYYHYYQYYRMRATPKVDARIVVAMVIAVISLIQKHSEALNYAVTVPKYRNAAMEIAKERGLYEFDAKTGKPKKNRKNRDNVDMEKIVRDIVEENMDVRGGYKKESVYDTLLWWIIVSPVSLLQYARWYIRWIQKYTIAGDEYEEEDKLYLIRSNLQMSESQFICLEPEEIKEFLELKLWIKENFVEWKAAKEIEEHQKMANSGRYKRYRRYMKNNAGSTMSFVE